MIVRRSMIYFDRLCSAIRWKIKYSFLRVSFPSAFIIIFDQQFTFAIFHTFNYALDGFSNLFLSVDCDGLSFRVIEAIHCTDVHDHGKTARQNHHEDEDNKECSQNGR